MNALLEPLQYTFMQYALLGTLTIGILCAVLGCYVVLSRLAFIGEGLAHGSLAGLALAYVLHWNFYLAGNLYTIALALVIGAIHEKAKVSIDTAIGILFSASMAAGIAIISTLKSYTTDLSGYLFGSVLAITPSDLEIILLAAALILGILIIFNKEFILYAFDPEMAEVAGLPRAALHYTMLVMIAVTVVIAARTVGIILITALLVIPAAAAFQWTRSWRRMLSLSVVFGMGSAVFGLYFSYYFNVASGASIALTAALLFSLSFVFGPRRKPWRRSLGFGTAKEPQT